MESKASNHPVVEEICRRTSGQQGRLRLALAIEGGGMRGVISAGMVAALESIGIKPDHFDAVFASSAGAFNGAYYIAEQARLGTSVYYENNSSEFIDARRLLRKSSRPALDLDYMLGDIMKYQKPLDFNKVVKAKKLRPHATEVGSAKKHVFEPAKDTDELYQQLRASATIPVVAGEPTKVLDRFYYDASLTEAVPLETPIEMGYDALLVLTTRPLVGHEATQTMLNRALDGIALRGLRRINSELAVLATRRSIQNLEKAKRLIRMIADPDEPPFAFTIAPKNGTAPIKRLEKRPEQLISGARTGYLAVKSALGLDLPEDFITEGWFEET